MATHEPALSAYVYSWSTNRTVDADGNLLDDTAGIATTLKAYGLTPAGETVCFSVMGFWPAVFLELVPYSGYGFPSAQEMQAFMQSTYPFRAWSYEENTYIESPVRVAREMKLGLFEAVGEVVSAAGAKSFSPRSRVFYRLEASSEVTLRRWLYQVDKDTREVTFNRGDARARDRGWIFPGASSVVARVHEAAAEAVLQMTTARDIPVTGWVEFGRAVRMETPGRGVCAAYRVNVADVRAPPAPPAARVPRLTVAAFDLEVFPSQDGVFPDGSKAPDRIFQISMVFTRDYARMEKYVLCLGTVEYPAEDEGVVLRCFGDEAALLDGFKELLDAKAPHVVTGWNIFGFDIPYLVARARRLGSPGGHLGDRDIASGGKRPAAAALPGLVHRRLRWDFFNLGFNDTAASAVLKRSMKTQAHGEESYTFLDAEGRLFVDMLPVIRHAFPTLASYSLESVGQEFLREGKCSDVGLSEIIEAYRLGVLHEPPRGATWDSVGNSGPRALGTVARYCVQDSCLVLRLMGYHNSLTGLAEMSAVTNVGMLDLVTKGQQVRVYAQVYRECKRQQRVVEATPRRYIAGSGAGKYQGAYVKVPTPGLYRNVAPFDFASLYPSIMEAYNIDFSSYVPPGGAPVPDELTHIVRWTDHMLCTGHHEEATCTGGFAHEYRFLKQETAGAPAVIPSVVRKLLQARKAVRCEIAALQLELKGPCSAERRDDIAESCLVLEARQLGYKISANSVYGGLGATVGPLQFRIGAMVTTAIGRSSFAIVERLMQTHGGTVVYGDTDSNYVIFPHLRTAEEHWDNAIVVAREISKSFPAPMRLEFEDAIYERFLILTPKQYVVRAVGRDGTPQGGGDGIKSRGVLLKRRDKSGVLVDTYRRVLMTAFEGHLAPSAGADGVFDVILACFLETQRSFDYQRFSMTRGTKRGGVRDAEGRYEPADVPEKPDKVQVGAYEVNRLPADAADRKRKIAAAECADAAEFYLCSVPCQVALADRMRARGLHVNSGDRIRYVVTRRVRGERFTAKLTMRVEEVAYFTRHASVLRLDRMWYQHSFVKPLDQLLEALEANLRELGLGGRRDYAKGIFASIEAKHRALIRIQELSQPATRRPELRAPLPRAPTRAVDGAGSLRAFLVPAEVQQRLPAQERGVTPVDEAYLVHAPATPSPALEAEIAAWLALRPPVPWRVTPAGEARYLVTVDRMLPSRGWHLHAAGGLGKHLAGASVEPADRRRGGPPSPPMGIVQSGAAATHLYAVSAVFVGRGARSFRHPCFGGRWASDTAAGARWVACSTAGGVRRPPALPFLPIYCPSRADLAPASESPAPPPQACGCPAGDRESEAYVPLRSTYYDVGFALVAHLVRPGGGGIALVNADGFDAYHPTFPTSATFPRQ